MKKFLLELIGPRSLVITIGVIVANALLQHWGPHAYGSAAFLTGSICKDVPRLWKS